MIYGYCVNDDVDYEYNARLDYTRELAIEHHDPEWNYPFNNTPGLADQIEDVDIDF